MHKQVIRVGGVPEHYNLPWTLAAERDIFSRESIDLVWTMYAGGTGAMTAALERDELDVAILLTEGFVAAAANGLQAKIVKVSIDTPLIWGVYTGAKSDRHTLEFDTTSRIAISRFGSGSHIMPMIHAHRLHQTFQREQCVVVNSLWGAVDSLTKLETDYFYWERFMTRPHVNSGELRMLGEFAAPWSSFLIIATDRAIAEKGEYILQMLRVMNAECIRFKQENASVVQISKRFDMTLAEARTWIQDTQWNFDFSISKDGLNEAIHALNAVGLLQHEFDASSWCAHWMNMI
jgi:sulfonate transport system substrate-binding protein